MPSREGRGLAANRRRSAMERLADIGAAPLEVVARRAALEAVMNRGGFWLLWQMEGGFDGLRRLGMPEATIYRKIKQFRESFGKHPDEFDFPGVEVNVEKYLRAQAEGATWPPVVSKATDEAPFSPRKTRE